MYSYKAKGILQQIPNHWFVGISAWISRFITALIQIASIRILTDGLGLEQYSVFALLVGLMGWFSLADFGLGLSLQNYISERRSKDQSFDDLVTITSIIAIIVLGTMLIFIYFLSPIVAPAFLKQYNFLNYEQKILLFFITGSIFTIITIGSISYKMWYAKQKGYLANIVPAIASILTFIGIFIINRSDITQKLYWSLLAYLSPPAICAVISYAVQVRKINFFIINIEWNALKGLLKRSRDFWFFALMGTITLQIDYIVLSQYVSNNEIVVYNISTKIFMFLFFLYSSFLTAIWPVFTEKIFLRDLTSIYLYIKRYLILGSSFMMVSIVSVIFFMPFIVNILSPNLNINVPIPFILLLGLYYLIRVCTDTYAMVLQSMSLLNPLWKWVPFQAILSAVFQWLLTPKYNVYGVILGLIGSYILTVMWSLPLNVYRKLSLLGKDIMSNN